MGISCVWVNLWDALNRTFFWSVSKGLCNEIFMIRTLRNDERLSQDLLSPPTMILPPGVRGQTKNTMFSHNPLAQLYTYLSVVDSWTWKCIFGSKTFTIHTMEPLYYIHTCSYALLTHCAKDGVNVVLPLSGWVFRSVFVLVRGVHTSGCTD